MRSEEIDESAVHHLLHTLQALEGIILTLRDQGEESRHIDDNQIEEVTPEIILGSIMVFAQILQIILIQAGLPDSFSHGGEGIEEL